MYNIALVIAYDGTDYLGWQDSKTGPSIEQTLRGVLEQILQHPIQVQAASRTDAGVHAEGQVANFRTVNLPQDLDKFRYSLNCLLPSAVRVLQAYEATADFHPTLDAQGKTYRYELCWGAVQYPRLRAHSWHFHKELDIAAMRTAAALLVGTHNFEAFCNQKKNESYENHERELTEIRIEEDNKSQHLCIYITGRSFLYKMVRNIVGTLVYVGCRKLCAEDVEKILAKRTRTEAGVTAPAHGLTLERVHYLGPGFV